jgi:hypothetical protein
MLEGRMLMLIRARNSETGEDYVADNKFKKLFMDKFSEWCISFKEECTFQEFLGRSGIRILSKDEK